MPKSLPSSTRALVFLVGPLLVLMILPWLPAALFSSPAEGQTFLAAEKVFRLQAQTLNARHLEIPDQHRKRQLFIQE